MNATIAHHHYTTAPGQKVLSGPGHAEIIDQQGSGAWGYPRSQRVNPEGDQLRGAPAANCERTQREQNRALCSGHIPEETVTKRPRYLPGRSAGRGGVEGKGMSCSRPHGDRGR